MAPKTVSCPICCEESTKKLVTCPACDHTACKTCTQRYIFEGTRDTADCMSCHAEWDRDHLAASFSKKWVTTDWKVYRENRLFERERGMMPATQLYIAWQDEVKALKDLRRDVVLEAFRVKEQIRLLALSAGNYTPMADLTLSKRGNYSAEVSKNALELKKDYNALKKRSAALHQQIGELYGRDPTRPPPQAAHLPAAPAAPEEPKLVMPCPADGCMGFILRPGYSCGMCATKVCKDCHVCIGDALVHKSSDQAALVHTCDPNDVLTTKALASESKPCPHCAAPTFKISGCNQMWCVVCHKPWNWITGKPEDGVIHNPHYFDYIRKNPNAADRAPHGLEFGAQDIVPGDGAQVIFPTRQDERTLAWIANPAYVPPMTTILMYVPTQNNTRLISRLYQRMTHLYVTERRELLDGYFTDNMQLRISFMRKQITEEQFKVQLQRYEKKMLKNADYARVIEAFCAAARNTLRDLVRMTIMADDAVVLLSKLWLDSGERLKTAAAKYQAKAPKFFDIDQQNYYDRNAWAEQQIRQLAALAI